MAGPDGLTALKASTASTSLTTFTVLPLMATKNEIGSSYFFPDPYLQPSQWKPFQLNSLSFDEIQSMGSKSRPEMKSEAIEKRHRSLIKTRLTLAKDLMQKHGLLYSEGWTVLIDKCKNRMGSCNSSTKTISFSMHLVLHAKDHDFLNIVLHEIAHGIVGHTAGHGPVWKHMAISIGCDGSRTCCIKEVINVVDALKTKFSCACGHTTSLQFKRPNKNITCSLCESTLNA